MSIEYDVKIKERPHLVKDMKPGDILHVGTEDKGEIFVVVKISDREFLFQQMDHDTAFVYSRGVMNQKIMDFEERYDTYYMVTEGNLDELGINT